MFLRSTRVVFDPLPVASKDSNNVLFIDWIIIVVIFFFHVEVVIQFVYG